MKGQIIKIESTLYTVKHHDKKTLCVLRGKFRKQHILPRVGDYVVFDEEKKVIEEILPRKNAFERPFVANIDLAFLVTSVYMPDLVPILLDKLLILMQNHQVTPIICVTKMDLLSKEKKQAMSSFFSYYQKIGYTVVYNDELDKIKKLIRGKTCVFTGQTGAGKSTLLNRLEPKWNLKTGEVSKALGRGKHTTRTVELLSFLGGKLLDTPGFSSLELSLKNEELQDAFPEFQKINCPFKDCTHTHEKECLVKKQVNLKIILESRYQSYLQLKEEVKKK